jgi:uncharacterized protein
MLDSGRAELAVFGPVAQGEDAQAIDLLYVLAPETVMGVIKLSWFREALEDVLGRSVDLVPKAGLHWSIRDRVLADSRVLYATAGPSGHRNAIATFTVGNVITDEDIRSLDDE